MRLIGYKVKNIITRLKIENWK